VRKREDFVGIINDVAATMKSEFFFVVRNLISGRANPFELGGGNTWLEQIQMLSVVFLPIFPHLKLS